MIRVEFFKDIDEESIIICKNLSNIPENHAFEYTCSYSLQNKLEPFKVDSLVLAEDSFITLTHLIKEIKVTFCERELNEWLEMYKDSRENYPHLLI